MKTIRLDPGQPLPRKPPKSWRTTTGRHGYARGAGPGFVTFYPRDKDGTGLIGDEIEYRQHWSDQEVFLND